MTRMPELDLGECTMCLACVEQAPEIFTENPAGYIEVREMDDYPGQPVNEAIAVCPALCISWSGGEED